MGKTAKRPENFPWVSAYISVKDVDAAVAFYEKAFGFRPKETAKGENGETLHAEVFYKDQVLMFGKAGTYGSDKYPPASTQQPCPMNLYAYCDDVDTFYDYAIKNGAVSVTAPEDAFWGDRMCCLKDPDGYEWVFATYTGSCKNSDHS